MRIHDFIRTSGIIGGDVYALIPYPGTEVWDYALKKGLVSGDIDWSRLRCDDFAERPDIVLADKVGPGEFVELYLKIRDELKGLLEANSRYLYARDYPIRTSLSSASSSAPRATRGRPYRSSGTCSGTG